MFNGYKTYILATLIALVTFLYYAGFIDQPAFNSAVAFLGAGGLASLRAGVSKEVEKVK